MSKFQFGFLTCLIVGVFASVSGLPAKSKPPLPYVQKNTCEGEDCYKQGIIDACREVHCREEGCSQDYCTPGAITDYRPKGYKTNSSLKLHVRSKPLASKISYIILPNQSFEILGYDLYTLKS